MWLNIAIVMSLYAAVPDAPGLLTSSQVTTTTIALNWSPPENTNGILLGYQVIFQANQNSDVSQVQTRKFLCLCNCAQPMTIKYTDTIICELFIKLYVKF